MSELSLLVVSNPSAPYLKWLKELPGDVRVTVGNTVEALGEAAPTADAILYCMGPGLKLSAIWDQAAKVRWVHSLSAGLESVLFPALAESDVPMTNARGVFKESLGEFALTAILYFAKDLKRMLRNQAAGRWEQFDVGMVTGKTLGILGYGEIGRAAAVRAKAMGMRVLTIRRRPELSGADPLVDGVYKIEDRAAMMAECDYVLLAAPLTEETRGLVGAAELQAMKPSAVLINLGRGPVVDEAALIDALRNGTIHGAALDVFDVEPLPAGHPFWSMDNLLLSPHCADHTATWTDEAMQFFLANFERFRAGQPLENLVNKKSGY